MTVLLAVGGLALAQLPATPAPARPQTTPLGTVVQDWTADVTPGTGKSADGATAFPKALAAARTALAGVRDYSATLVRQERVSGKLLPEQTCSLVARTAPTAIRVGVTAPPAVAGTTTTFVAARNGSMVRHRAAGPGDSQFTKTLPLDDPAALIAARHPVTGYGLVAVLDRVDGVLKAQAVQHRPTQVLVSDVTFAGKPATRFEVFADRPTADGPRRLVLCLDPTTKLPVRYEAYGAATAAAPGGELLEVDSFLGTKVNVGLGDVAFER